MKSRHIDPRSGHDRQAGSSASAKRRFGGIACTLALVLSLLAAGPAAAQSQRDGAIVLSEQLTADAQLSPLEQDADTYFYRVRSWVQLRSQNGLENAQDYMPHSVPPAGQGLWDVQSANLEGTTPGQRSLSRTYAHLDDSLRSGWIYHDHRAATKDSNYAKTGSSIMLDLSPTHSQTLTVDVSRSPQFDGETYVVLRHAWGDTILTDSIENGSLEMTIPAGDYLQLIIGSDQHRNGTYEEISDTAMVTWSLTDACQAADGTWVC